MEKWFCATGEHERGERGSDDLTVCKANGLKMCASNKPVPICCKKAGSAYCNYEASQVSYDCDNSTMPMTPDACDHNGEQVGRWLLAV